VNSSKKELIKVLLQGSGSLGLASAPSEYWLREMALFSLSEDWCFSNLAWSEPTHYKEYKPAGIKTFRFFAKAHQNWTMATINCFAWEHYKRKLSFHPLVALQLLDRKVDGNKLDLSIIQAVGSLYFESFGKLKRAKNKSLFLIQKSDFADVSISSDLHRILESELKLYPEWSNPEHWPRDKNQKKYKEWYQLIAKLSNEEVYQYFQLTPELWVSILIGLSNVYPEFSQYQLDRAVAANDKDVLNAFFRQFMDPVYYKAWSLIDLSELLRAIPLKHALFTMAELSRSGLEGLRLMDMIFLTKVNYHEWPASEIRKIPDIYQQIVKSKGDSEALEWLELAAHRVETSLEAEFISTIQAQLKAEVTYRMIPAARSIFQTRRDIKALFSS